MMLIARGALAQDAGDVGTARSLGTEGLRLAESGNCEAAVEKLSRAERLFHAPTTLERLGECQVKLGRYVEGSENLRRVAREHLADGAPAPFFAAQTRAKEALEAAVPHIAKLRVEVAGASADAIVLKIDGQVVSAASIGVERPIDPGKHVVDATAPGTKPAQQTITIADGGSKDVSLTLERDPNQTATTTIVHEEPHAQARTTRVLWPAGVAFGVAGVSFVVGSVFGGTAIIKKNNLVTACSGTACPSSQRGAFDDLSTFAAVSTVGFVVAGVAAAAGIVLFVVAPRHTVVESVSVRASLGGVSLGGTF